MIDVFQQILKKLNRKNKNNNLSKSWTIQLFIKQNKKIRKVVGVGWEVVHCIGVTKISRAAGWDKLVIFTV